MRERGTRVGGGVGVGIKARDRSQSVGVRARIRFEMRIGVRGGVGIGTGVRQTDIETDRANDANTRQGYERASYTRPHNWHQEVITPQSHIKHMLLFTCCWLDFWGDKENTRERGVFRQKYDDD